jgi:hypothetical protein
MVLVRDNRSSLRLVGVGEGWLDVGVVSCARRLAGKGCGLEGLFAIAGVFERGCKAAALLSIAGFCTAIVNCSTTLKGLQSFTGNCFVRSLCIFLLIICFSSLNL